MTILTLIIAIAALAAAITALLKKPKQEVVNQIVEKIIEKHDPEQPFKYDAASYTWHLEGNLDVSGHLSCLDKKKEDKK